MARRNPSGGSRHGRHRERARPRLDCLDCGQGQAASESTSSGRSRAPGETTGPAAIRARPGMPLNRRGSVAGQRRTLHRQEPPASSTCLTLRRCGWSRIIPSKEIRETTNYTTYLSSSSGPRHLQLSAMSASAAQSQLYQSDEAVRTKISSWSL